MIADVNGVLSFIQIWKQYFSGEDTVYAVIPVSVFHNSVRMSHIRAERSTE